MARVIVPTQALIDEARDARDAREILEAIAEHEAARQAWANRGRTEVVSDGRQNGATNI